MMEKLLNLLSRCDTFQGPKLGPAHAYYMQDNL